MCLWMQTTSPPCIRIDRNARLAAMLIHGRKLVFFPLFREDVGDADDLRYC